MGPSPSPRTASRLEQEVTDRTMNIGAEVAKSAAEWEEQARQRCQAHYQQADLRQQQVWMRQQMGRAAHCGSNSGFPEMGLGWGSSWGAGMMAGMAGMTWMGGMGGGVGGQSGEYASGETPFETVQAVALKHWASQNAARDMYANIAPPYLPHRAFKPYTHVGLYDAAARRGRVARHLVKRRYRTWSKKTLYDVRENIANQRLRYRGRFVKQGEEEYYENLIKEEEEEEVRVAKLAAERAVKAAKLAKTAKALKVAKTMKAEEVEMAESEEKAAKRTRMGRSYRGGSTKSRGNAGRR